MTVSPGARTAVQIANQMLRVLPAADENNVARELLKQIKKNGYGCTAVMPVPSRQARGWTYTVGLCLYGLPELVIAHMPAHLATAYLGHAAAVQRGGVTLRDTDVLVMGDGSLWTAVAHDPRATLYGLRHAMRLFGSTYRVRALRLTPPQTLQWPPGSSWTGYLDDSVVSGRSGRVFVE